MKMNQMWTVLTAATLAIATAQADGPAVYDTLGLSGDWDAIQWRTNSVNTSAIPGEDPMDVVNFPYQSPATGPYKLNGSRVVGSVGSRNNGGWTIEQTNPGDTLTINSPYNGNHASLESPAIYKNNVGFTFKVPIILGTNVYIYGTESNGGITLTKGWTDGGHGYSVTKVGNGPLTYSDDVTLGAAPSFGDLNLREGSVNWKPNLTTLPAALSSFGLGAMHMDGGGFTLNLNNSAGGTVTYSSGPVRVAPGSGAFTMEGNSAGHTLTINNFNVELGGALVLGSGSSQPGTTTYNGSFAVVKTNATVNAIISVMNGSNAGTLGASPITDAEGGLFTRQPLVLKSFDRSPLAIAGDNSYTGGTVIDSLTGVSYGTGHIAVDAASNLGTGDVWVHPYGRLRLGAASNLATGRKVTVFYNGIQLGYVGMTYDGLAPISEDSSGILGIDTTTFTQALDMATIGDGTLFLGSLSTGTYGASTLGAGIDNIYRLGGGLGTLTFVQGNVLSGSATAMQVGSVLAGGTGTVRFNAAQNHTLPVTVNNGSTLQGVGQTTADASAFGKGALTLVGGTLQLINNGTATYATNSALTFVGGGRLLFSVADWQVNAMQFENMVRNTTHRGTLVISAANLGTGVGRNEGRVVVSNPPATVSVNAGTATMVAPFFVGNNDRTFLTYGANGFMSAPWTPTTDLNSVNNANAEVFKTTKDQTGANIVVNPTTVHALRVDHNIAGAALTISSGGILVSESKTIDNAIDLGAEGVVMIRSQRNLVLNGPVTATDGLTFFTEPVSPGMLYLKADNSATLFGPITINTGKLEVPRDDSLGAAANDVVLNGGGLRVSRKTTAPADPVFETSRTLRTGPAGGLFDSNSNNGTFTYNGSIILDGPLTVTVGGNTQLNFYGPIQDAPGKMGTLILSGSMKRFYTAAASMTYSGGTLIRMPVGVSNDGSMAVVYSGSRLGTGDVIVEQGRLALEDDAAISPTARLWTSLDAPIGGEKVFFSTYRNYTYFRSASPEIGSLEGLGQIVLGNETTPVVNTTLTLGGDDTDSAFYGSIRQTSGRVGSVTKKGSGTFTLGGANSYTGTTTVNDGTLRLVGSLVGGVSVGASGTLSGNGVVGGDLSVAGTLQAGLNGVADIDGLTVGGTATFVPGATLEITGNYRPDYGQPVTVLTAANGINGLPVAPDGYRVAVGNNTLTLIRKVTGTMIQVR